MSYEYDFDVSKYLTQDNTVHSDVHCDQCGVRPMRNLRFKCTICQKYDLCVECFLSGLDVSQRHSRSHPMHVITRSYGNSYESIGTARSEDVLSFH